MADLEALPYKFLRSAYSMDICAIATHRGWLHLHRISTIFYDSNNSCHCLHFPQGVDGDICLRTTDDNSVSETTGFVHIWFDKKWRKVCDPEWGFTESTIVCRQLGLIAPLDHNPSYETTSHNVICSGTEQRLTDCKHTEWHDNCNDGVHVSCSTNIPGLS